MALLNQEKKRSINYCEDKIKGAGNSEFFKLIGDIF